MSFSRYDEESRHGPGSRVPPCEKSDVSWVSAQMMDSVSEHRHECASTASHVVAATGPCSPGGRCENHVVMRRTRKAKASRLTVSRPQKPFSRRLRHAKPVTGRSAAREPTLGRELAVAPCRQQALQPGSASAGKRVDRQAGVPACMRRVSVGPW